MLRLNVCLVYFYFQSFENWLFENFTIKKKKAFKKVVLKSAILICHFNTLFLYFINRNFLRIFLTLFFYNNQSLE